MLDYRVRGYIEHRSTLGGSACANSTITACARQGRLLLRASSNSLKVEGPPTGFAVLGNTLIDCPTGVATISADSSGNNPMADGTFPPDRTNPALIPALPFVVTPSGDPNGIQIRTLGSTGQCIYGFQVSARCWRGRWVLPRCVGTRQRRLGFMTWVHPNTAGGMACMDQGLNMWTLGQRRNRHAPLSTHQSLAFRLPLHCMSQLMQATSYILGVQPVQWISIWGAACARAASPALMLACSLAAVLAAWALR